MGASGKSRSIRSQRGRRRRPCSHFKQDMKSILTCIRRETAHAKEKTMPLVTIKVFKDELSDSQAKDLIHKVTETGRPVAGPYAYSRAASSCSTNIFSRTPAPAAVHSSISRSPSELPNAA